MNNVLIFMIIHLTPFWAVQQCFTNIKRWKAELFTKELQEHYKTAFQYSIHFIRNSVFAVQKRLPPPKNLFALRLRTAKAVLFIVLRFTHRSDLFNSHFCASETQFFGKFFDELSYKKARQRTCRRKNQVAVVLSKHSGYAEYSRFFSTVYKHCFTAT